MPTRPLPPMGRTHEDQHPALLPSIPCTSLTVRLPSSLHSHPPPRHKDAGKREQVDIPVFPPPISPSLSPKGDELALYPHFVPAHSLFSSHLLHQGQVFVSFKYKKVCYMRSIWLVGGGQWGCEGWDERLVGLQERQQWCFIHPLIVMVQVVFLL